MVLWCVCECVYCVLAWLLAPLIFTDTVYPLACGRQCFCSSCDTEAQLLRHDNKMQSMKLTVAPSEKSPPNSPFFSTLLHFFPSFDIESYSFAIPLISQWEKTAPSRSTTTVKAYVYTQEITNSLYFSHLVVLLLGCVKINGIFNMWSSRMAHAEPQSI